MAKKEKKIVSPVKSLKLLERQYQKVLNKLGKTLINAIRIELYPFLKSSESSYVIDGVSNQLQLIFEKLNRQFTGTIVAGFANLTAEQMVQRTMEVNKQKFDKNVHRATGVDLGSVIANEGLDDFVKLSVNKNIQLITNIPEDYLKQIEVIVNNGVVSGARFSTIAKQISGIKGANSKLGNRIGTIARNEVQTINAQITLRRSQNLGITKGIYRTSQDERVRKCHAELNGVEYLLKKGAYSKTCKKYIQPGVTDINCRCSYSPIIEV